MESSGRITSEEIAHCSRRVDHLCVPHLSKRVHGFVHRAISRLERCHNNGRFPLCRFGRYCFSPRGWPAIVSVRFLPLTQDAIGGASFPGAC